MTSIFFADTYGTHEPYGGSSDSSFSGGTGVASLDPVVMVSAMAHITKHMSFAITWEDGAQVWSVDPEIAYDPSKIHRIEFNGKYHKLSATLQTHLSPQRTPTLFQAGASKAGIDFAGKHAEGIYCGVANIPDLLKYTKQIRATAVSHGRDPSTVKVFCGMTTIIGRTLEEAYAKHDAAKALADTSYLGGLAAFCWYTGVNLSQYTLDEPFTFNGESQDDASIQGIFNIFKGIEREDNQPWTPRRIGQRYSFGGLGPKTPDMVADFL